jgi:hypothetical protein
VNESLGVRGLERLRDLQGHAQNFAGRHRPAADAVGQRFPIDVFDDEILRAVLGADVMQSADVRMGYRCNGARLALEPQPRPPRACTSRKNLDRNDAVQTGIASLVDFTHSAGADPGDDFVRAETSAGRKGHELFRTAVIVRRCSFARSQARRFPS